MTAPDPPTPASHARIVLAALVAVGAPLLAMYRVLPAHSGALVARGGVGPATWPRLMLFCLAACAAGLLLIESARAIRAARTGGRTGPAEPGTPKERSRILQAIVLLAAFGMALPIIGFALATPVFLAAWMLGAGWHRPWRAGATSVVGTALLLMFFAGVSHMPLDRGEGLFDTITVWIYRGLGIY